jgi:hypothetical protein
MHGISRVCDTIDENLIKIEVILREHLKIIHKFYQFFYLYLM